MAHQEDFFLIIGCQRSGTTLIRLILECHSGVRCFDELTSYRILAEGLKNGAANGNGRKLGFKIPRWTEQLDEPVLGDEGEPIAAKRFYNRQKIVFMLRDARDTIASMGKLKSGDTSWIDIWPAAIIAAKIRNHPTFSKDYCAELEILEKCRDSDRTVAAAALYWKYKTRAFFQYEQEGYPLLGVRYAALVNDTEPVLRNMCDFLEIDFQSALLNHPAFPHTEILDNGMAVGNTDPHRAIHTESVGQWRTRLSASQLDIILAIAGDTQKILDQRWPTSSRSSAMLYDANYYARGCGPIPYERNAHWLTFFSGIASELTRSLRPRRVFDAGCAWGFLVEAFWDQGVEAYGVDISAYAIGKVRPNVKPFCRVASLTEPVAGPFDLITCIEVLEHMPPEEAEEAVRRMTVASDAILFSSTPNDFAEPTHVNVRPLIYWLKLFARHSFGPDLLYDASFISPHAFLVRRQAAPPSDDVLMLFGETLRNRVYRAAFVTRQTRLEELERERHQLTAEVNQLHQKCSGLQSRLVELQAAQRELRPARADF